MHSVIETEHRDQKQNDDWSSYIPCLTFTFLIPSHRQRPGVMNFKLNVHFKKTPSNTNIWIVKTKSNI